MRRIEADFSSEAAPPLLPAVLYEAVAACAAPRPRGPGPEVAAPLLCALLRRKDGGEGGNDDAVAATLLERALPPLSARLADAAAPLAARSDALAILLAVLREARASRAAAAAAAAAAAEVRLC